PAFYLSLYDGELDQRVHGWRSNTTADAAGSAAADHRALAAHLEPTDALSARCADAAIVAARGGCCTFPLYPPCARDVVEVAPSLPVADRPMLSAEGLVRAAAAVNLCSSYEPNAWSATPLAGWRRLR